LGPELTRTEGNGLAPFFYLPHALLIAKGVDHFQIGMEANYELAKRFTAEFSIRPYIAAHPRRSLKLLERWAKDANPHIRRAASEGTRPRLPWGMRLDVFINEPKLTLKLLEKLKDDPELYVRRSVANHLADLLKDHPELAYEICERWLSECDERLDKQRAEARRWIVRHAVRLPARKGEKRAMALRTLGK